jgi:hypothetical protein
MAEVPEQAGAAALCGAGKDVAGRWASVGQRPGVAGGRAGIGDRDADRIGRDELRELTGQGAQLVEVLPGDPGWAHLPGAVNLPLKELDARTGRLDYSRPVIVYCRDWY